MKFRVAALFIVAVVIALVIGARLGGWGDKLGGGQVPSHGADILREKVSIAPPAPPPVAPAVTITPPAPEPGPVSPPPAMPVAKSGGPVIPAPVDAPSPLDGKPDLDHVEKATEDIDQIGLMLRDFRTLMGTNPVGTNAEIMKAVNGGNPTQARLGPPAGQKLNGNGELVDEWGTPYFFHQMSATQMDISSAGPDKTFGTSDDVTGR